MVARVDAKEAQRLMADGVQFVDVLPADVFVQEHLPGARNLPLATFTIRPELRIDEVRERLDRDGLDHVFVSAVDGVLLGLVVTEELHV